MAQGPVDDAWAADWVLTLRIPLFCVVSTVLGLVGHVAAGGGIPSVANLALVAVAVFVAARSVGTSQQSLPRLVAMLWATQAGVHVLLPSSHCSTPLALWAGHALAGLLVAAWLRRGEAWAWRAAGHVLRLLGPCRTPTDVVVVRVPCRPPSAVVVPTLDLWSRRLLPQRAPPATA
jgi:hypothetical protein